MSMQTDKPAPGATRPRPDGLTRFFGGSPMVVIFRLALLSILVGLVLEVLGLDPWNILESMRALYQRIWDMGFETVRWLGRYLLLGAAIVVPIWLIMRLMNAPRGR